jgi:hypothetical protein
VRVFKTKDFARFARKERIDDAALCDAIIRAERGLIDASLGGGLIKQRVPRRGEGRSGGYRTLIVYQRGNISMFIHGFAKNDMDNIGDRALENLKAFASVIFTLDARAIEQAVEKQLYIEVDCDA